MGIPEDEGQEEAPEWKWRILGALAQGALFLALYTVFIKMVF